MHIADCSESFFDLSVIALFVFLENYVIFGFISDAKAKLCLTEECVRTGKFEVDV